jgi:hypothetical protein
MFRTVWPSSGVKSFVGETAALAAASIQGKTRSEVISRKKTH